MQNTPEGTVVGVAQGFEDDVEQLKSWLTTVGSPKSRIDRAEFTEEREINTCEFEEFDVRRE